MFYTNILNTEYVNKGSDIQNKKIESNIKMKEITSFKYLRSIFTNSKKCEEH